MANKPNKQKRMEKQRREQEALNRVFNIFLVGIAAECYLLTVYNKFVNGIVQESVTWSYIVEYLGYAGVLAVMAGAVLTVWKKKERLGKIGLWVAGIGAFFALSSMIIMNIYPEGSQFLCVLVPILTVMGLVYCLFQREFFFNAVVMAGAIFTLWVCRKGLGTVNWNTKVTVGVVVVLLGLAAAAAVVRWLQTNNGSWKGIQIFGKTTDYRLIYGVLAVSFAVILLALILPVSAFYTMWVMGIALFALAVFYTTKLM